MLCSYLCHISPILSDSCKESAGIYQGQIIHTLTDASGPILTLLTHILRSSSPIPLSLSHLYILRSRVMQQLVHWSLVLEVLGLIHTEKVFGPEHAPLALVVVMILTQCIVLRTGILFGGH